MSGRSVSHDVARLKSPCNEHILNDNRMILTRHTVFSRALGSIRYDVGRCIFDETQSAQTLVNRIAHIQGCICSASHLTPCRLGKRTVQNLASCSCIIRQQRVDDCGSSIHIRARELASLRGFCGTFVQICRFRRKMAGYCAHHTRRIAAINSGDYPLGETR